MTISDRIGPGAPGFKTPQGFPVDDGGNAIEPNPHFDGWDQTPHAYFTVGMNAVALGDVVLGGTHQIEGFGRAEQRGFESRRFDLEYIAAQSMEYTARLILPIDHMLEVKRYFPDAGHRWSWVKMKSSTMRDLDGSEQVLAPPAGLVPDYGARVDMCGCGNDDGSRADDGYDAGAVMCDACADSWAIDHLVVRHRA